MADGNVVCYVGVLIVSLAVAVYGFMQILRSPGPRENDIQVIQRQIQGFAFLVLAQVTMVLGMAMCVGWSFGFSVDTMKNTVRSMRI